MTVMTRLSEQNRLHSSSMLNTVLIPSDSDLARALEGEIKYFAVVLNEDRKTAKTLGSRPEPLGPLAPQLAIALIDVLADMPSIGESNRNTLNEFLTNTYDSPTTVTDAITHVKLYKMQREENLGKLELCLTKGALRDTIVSTIKMKPSMSLLSGIPPPSALEEDLLDYLELIRDL